MNEPQLLPFSITDSKVRVVLVTQLRNLFADICNEAEFIDSLKSYISIMTRRERRPKIVPRCYQELVE